MELAGSAMSLAPSVNAREEQLQLNQLCAVSLAI